MSKKKKIWFGIVAVIVVAAAIIASLPAGRKMLASVISTWPVPINIHSCYHPNNLFACAHCATVPDVILACSLGLSTCPVVCQNPTATWTVCPVNCANVVCNDPGVVTACQLNPNGPLCPSACASLFPSWYSYGYGYGRGGQGTGYGYGYGYKKIEVRTSAPYLYLLNVFKTYPKNIYDAAVKKLGWFKMVSFYNKKEFTPAATTKTTLPTRK